MQTFAPANTDCPPIYEMLKEEHQVAALGAPYNPAPPTSTVIHIRSETSVPDHVLPLLGFIAFTYSVKSRDRKMVVLEHLGPDFGHHHDHSADRHPSTDFASLSIDQEDSSRPGALPVTCFPRTPPSTPRPAPDLCPL
uniref:Uncharacterized protein n=1 Tax=Cebus imitator TaxID=2715852 RepID=A0A2K5QU65_CEBIM